MRPLNRTSFQDIRVCRNDLDGARAWMSQVCGPHHLEARSPNKIRFNHTGNMFHAMHTMVGRIAYGTDVSIHVEDVDRFNSYSISLPLSGEQELKKGGRRIASNPHQGLIIAPNELQVLDISGDCQKIQIAITCFAMRQTLESMLGRPITTQLAFEPAINAESGATGSWWRLARYYLMEIETSKDLFGQSMFAQDIEGSLIKGLILAQENNYSNELHSVATVQWPQYLIKAKAFINEHAREDICLEDVERACGVARVKLFEVFRKYVGVPPMAYLKRLRFDGARQELMRERSGGNVSVIAMAWGFKHVGRFSIEYKKIFGESPSATLSRQ
ncbi:helix-turn-helix domain-containing protein [Pseudomonas sp. NPDC008258]|uniref:AraC family transcriptional regulator n=1 Tax=Pseudomonas sp. NPDC008258 TaxID=3364418 RepID=UPI0036E02AC6